ncbi:hypothetical protein DZC30_14115 [Comamonas testosteroni]|uniref:Uncharacterized protein n=1 Tax=Comamonas testosteroni TaxID=285 RepID=A0A373FHY1_COMTE|nr:hypothetical protein [Comamonas testosteroni]RGE43744.1 hypothetical protein DZC30_14115 [Comamonas testosteroni]
MSFLFQEGLAGPFPRSALLLEKDKSFKGSLLGGSRDLFAQKRCTEVPVYASGASPKANLCKPITLRRGTHKIAAKPAIIQKRQNLRVFVLQLVVNQPIGLDFSLRTGVNSP